MELLLHGPGDAPAVLLLGHSAGAPMDSPWMNAICDLLAGHRMRTARFEFPYMTARRGGGRRPPPKAELSVDEYRSAVSAVRDAVGPDATLLIGGKSYGGRVASLLADELHDAGVVAGLVCLGYPFHPPERPAQLRTAHLIGLRCPALICQGERDPFGGVDEVPALGLSSAIRMRWFPGAHDVQPRTRLAPVADAVAGFARTLT